MRAGPLDRRITLQRYSFTTDPGSGEQVKTWSTLGPASISAAALPVSDSERVASAEVSAEITMRFQIRYDPAWDDLNPKDRVSYDNKSFDIVGVKELGRREGLEISAIARADE